MPAKERKEVVQSVIRAFRLLEIISHEQPVSLNELARKSGYKKTTVSRLASTLKMVGMVNHDPSDKLYSVSLNAVELAGRVLNKLEVRRLIRPLIERFVNDQRISVLISVLDVNEVIYIDKVLAIEAFRISMNIGQRIPVYCSASGKAFLAFLEPKIRSNILDHTVLKPMTKNTITRRDELEKELELVRRQGFALDRTEMVEGVCSAAAPIFGPNQMVQAVISAPRMDKAVSKDELYALGQKLADLSKEISSRVNLKGDMYVPIYENDFW